MNILYICELNYKKKAGLYNATINRIEEVQKKHNVKVFAFMKQDKFLIGKIKKFMKVSTEKDILEVYKENNVEYNNLIFLDTFIKLLLRKLGYDSRVEFYEKKLSEYIEKNDVDIIHAHWAYPQGYIAKRLSEKYNIPYIVTCHGSDIHTIPKENSLIKKYTLEALENASKVFFVSNKLKEQAEELGYKGENAIISSNGIRQEFFKGEISNKKLKKKVGYLGNFLYIKGVDRLPKIFSFINKEIECEFEIIGDGDLRKQILEELDNLKVKYKYYGKIDPGKVKDILKEFDILIVPSRNEGWPVVILEANALGVYVVGSNVGGIPEAIASMGSLVDVEGNAIEENFAKEAIRVLEEGYNSRALRERTKNYTWDNIIKKELEIYKFICENRE